MNKKPLTEKDIQALVDIRVAMALKKAGVSSAKDLVYQSKGFRVKKETANPQSSLEQRSYRGFSNSGVGSITVTGSKAGNAALTSLLSVLNNLHIVIDQTT